MGYKAVYKGPVSGRERIRVQSVALSFIIVGWDFVRLDMSKSAKKTLYIFIDIF